mmetsp:Transcript_59159/g.109314  ORF Transcript_59159/g.109314 Transcript_59159/m.109314 type:complete len:312 (-) Transcript_59159:241-1176(-)
MAGAPISELKFLKAVVIKPHMVYADVEQSVDAPQLSLEVNEIVHVFELDESGWWGGHKEGQEETKGWFPGNCIRVVAWGGGPDGSRLACRYPAPHTGAKRATSSLPAASEDLQRALKEIEELKAVNETLRNQSQQSLQTLQRRCEAAEKEAHAARQELDRQSKRHAEIQEELQRTKRLSEVQASELKSFHAKQMEQKQEQKQQKENELNKRVADISARYESRREERHAHKGKEEMSQQVKTTPRLVAEELHQANRHTEVQVSELKKIFEQRTQPKHTKELESNKQVANSAARYDTLRAQRDVRGAGIGRLR